MKELGLENPKLNEIICKATHPLRQFEIHSKKPRRNTKSDLFFRQMQQKCSFACIYFGS